MESGVPMLNCLLQHTLRSLCTFSDSSTPSKWVYAVFWKIIPRNYPPPKWDHGGGLLDRAKGNKRNWILVWEDGFCDFCECERAGTHGCGERRFGADIFFKMTHEVYNFGEGLVGKVASDNSHKWVFRDCPTENDTSFISSWNVSIDPPRAWEAQFNSGIETIALIPVREGAIQLGSFDKVVEDLDMVLSIQRKFSYLQSLPGIYAIQRPYLPIQNPHFDYNNAYRLMQTNGMLNGINDKHHQMSGLKRQKYEQSDNSPPKSIYLGYNSPQMCSIPPLLPSDFAALFSKIPSVPVPYYAPEVFDHENMLLNNNGSNLKSGSDEKLKSDECVVFDVKVEEDEEKPLEDGVVASGFASH